MAILNIVKDTDEILRKKSKDVDKIDDKLLTLIEDMKETMEKAGGVGLAAVQIGKLKKLVVIDTGEDQLTLINPKMIKSSGSQEDLEGCLSCPGRWGMVRRPMKVVVENTALDGTCETIKAEGFLAKAICHEMDHLEGKLFYDNATRMLTQEEIEAL